MEDLLRLLGSWSLKAKRKLPEARSDRYKQGVRRGGREPDRDSSPFQKENCVYVARHTPEIDEAGDFLKEGVTGTLHPSWDQFL